MIAPDLIDALVARINEEATDFTCDFFREGSTLRSGKWCSVVDFQANFAPSSRGPAGSASLYTADWVVEFVCASSWERATPHSAAIDALEVARVVARAVLDADNLGLNYVVSVTAEGLRLDHEFTTDTYFCLRFPVKIRVYDRALV